LNLNDPLDTDNKTQTIRYTGHFEILRYLATSNKEKNNRKRRSTFSSQMQRVEDKLEKLNNGFMCLKTKKKSDGIP